MADFDELMREEEQRMEREANTPERIEEDRQRMRRSRVRAYLSSRRARGEAHCCICGAGLGHGKGLDSEMCFDCEDDESDEDDE